MRDHLVIFDTQIKPGDDLEFCTWMGNYAAQHRPDVIVFIGDWWDMVSLNVYEKPGSHRAEGVNLAQDLRAGHKGMQAFFAPIIQVQKHQRSQKKAMYSPERHFTLGNHEERMERYLNDNPKLIGTVGYEDLLLDRWGIQMHDFLDPVIIDGVQYVHYVKNKNSNYPKASAKATIEQTMMSTIQGHKPGLDVYCCFSDQTGRNAWSIINGSSYVGDEHFRRGSGNNHWRGIVHLRDVQNGDFTPQFISMDYLEDHYG